MWMEIDIVLAVIGLCMFGWAKHTDSSENMGALLLGVSGVAVVLSGVASELVRFAFTYG